MDAPGVLGEQGLLRRSQPAGSSARHQARTGDNQTHVACRPCGTTADVDCAPRATSCLTASDSSGFAFDEAEVVCRGDCPTCRTHGPPREDTA